jgi:hypothetical protein
VRSVYARTPTSATSTTGLSTSLPTRTATSAPSPEPTKAAPAICAAVRLSIEMRRL